MERKKKVQENVVNYLTQEDFDVPELDTVYIDKPIQQHTLIQTISRVNRVCEGKDKGLIVDYIGIKKNMNTALKKYTNFESEEFEGVEQTITIVKDQLEVLGQMFHNFIHLKLLLRLNIFMLVIETRKILLTDIKR